MKWALHKLASLWGPPAPQSALLMARSHNFLLFLWNGCDPLGMLNILYPSLDLLVQLTAQQLLVMTCLRPSVTESPSRTTVAAYFRVVFLPLTCAVGKLSYLMTSLGNPTIAFLQINAVMENSLFRSSV